MRGERQSRKVKKEQSRERFVAAMRREAAVEEEGGRERDREVERGSGWLEKARDRDQM